MQRVLIQIIKGLMGGLVLALLSLNLLLVLELNRIPLILSSLGHNLNTNPKEGFAIVSVCTDMWKETMMSRHCNQEEKCLGLDHKFLIMTNTIQGTQSSFLGLQIEFRRMDEIVIQHETIIPRLRLEVESSS